MKLKCTKMPHAHANCLVATLGAGKAVKFFKDSVVDLTDSSLGLDNPTQVGYMLLSKYSDMLEVFNEQVSFAEKQVKKVVKKAEADKSAKPKSII